MGFTVLLAFVFAALILGTIFAFIKRKITLGIILLALLVIGTGVLGFFWFTSPM